MSGNTIIINQFFADNYHLLVQKCRDYSRVYGYKALAPDELISELYLYTLDSEKRTSKLEELILLSAATVSKAYAYTSQAFYYVSRILYNLTHGNRTFESNCNKITLVLSFEQDLEKTEIPDIEYQETPEYDPEKVYARAKELGVGDNWWRYIVWFDYYHEKMTYKQLSEKYRLTQTPLFYGVRDFNTLLRGSLKSDQSF